MSQIYWKCDPDEHVEGQTYVRVTNLLQGHIENEIDLNAQASCRKSCEPYNFAQPQSCYKDLFCAKQNPCQVFLKIIFWYFYYFLLYNNTLKLIN